jgi:hypothetical protein
VSSVNTVREFVWHVEIDYSIVAGDDGSVLLRGRVQNDVITASDISPKPAQSVRDPIEVFVGALDKPFCIDRSKRSCHTPIRNDDVECILSALAELSAWCDNVGKYIYSSVLLFAPHSANAVAQQLQEARLFVPVAPLVVSQPNDVNVLLSADDERLMLQEHARDLSTKIVDIEKTFASTNPLVICYFSFFADLINHLILA